MTHSQSSGRSPRIGEWRTYTPDGRPLTVRRGDRESWTAVCGDTDGVEHASLRQAITRALAEGEPAQLLPRGSKLEEWIGEQSRQIEEDWRAEGLPSA